MKIRTLIVYILGVLIVSCLSPAQDMDAPEPQLPEPAFGVSDSPALPQPEPSLVAQAPSPSPPRPQAPRSRGRGVAMTTPSIPAPPSVRPMAPTIPQAPQKSPKEVKIFQLRYAEAANLSSLIWNLFGVSAQIDVRMNRLIVNAKREQIQSVEDLIRSMDVTDPEASTARDIQNLVYRIYMLEIPSGDQGMKSFSMILQTSAQLSSTELLDAAATTQIQISDFFLSEEGDGEQAIEILIQGKAPTNESIKQMIGKIPYVRIRELKWDDDETFTNNIPGAQYTRLPEQLQKHIAKFLGNDIRTVGYWFGNLSVPGTIEAPIGPWRLSMSLNTESDRMLELQVDVEAVGEEEQIGEETWRQQIDEILSNTIRVKIGKPIIIGYNRESYGTRKMGAMVIVPEEDSL